MRSQDPRALPSSPAREGAVKTEEILMALLEKAGPVGLVAYFWYLSERKAWETVDRLSASVVKLALLRAREGRKT